MCSLPAQRPIRRRQPNWGHPDHDACGTGFIARLHGPPTHEILQFSLQALERLSHRGGVDADGASGDGAGLLTSLPKDFFRAKAAELNIVLGDLFGVGMLFVPGSRLADARAAMEDAVGRSKLSIAGWRRVPTDSTSLGQRSLETMPEIWQCFIEPVPAKTAAANSAAKFERALWLLRKRAEGLLPERSYFCSLSSRTIVYKGLLTPWQFPRFFEDMRNPEFTASFAIFHQRYSTNTEPSWQLAQPFRYVAHNGEINTVISNRRWLRARQRDIRKRLAVGKWFSLLEENVSDSASFDNALEIRLLQNKSVEASMLSLVPPAFAHDPFLSGDVRIALEALSREGEPWDGPAAMVFSDGISVGVKLDRNGLRPMRYTVTHDGLVIAGSETGLVDLDESRIAERHRLGPGEMILAHPGHGSFLRWREVLKTVTAQYPKKSIRQPRRLTLQPAASRLPVADARRVAASAGWSEDQYKILFRPLLAGKEADWSMGDDAPPAFLSAITRPLWDYCKQRFAQVTNPPIDPLREAHVMSLEMPLGADYILPGPILSVEEFAALREKLQPIHLIDFTCSSTLGVSSARRSLTQCSTTPLRDGERPGLLLLSDRAISKDRAALPALLATARLWKNMVAGGFADVPLVVESGQVFDTHHVAMLLAAGASAVVPYLAQEFAELEEAGAFERVRKGMNHGLHKVLARMGISTMASYRNSHLFEVLGLDEDICREFFEDAGFYPGTKSLDGLLQDYLNMHSAAWSGAEDLADQGLYRFRKGAEIHANSPEFVRKIHALVRGKEAGPFSAIEELGKSGGPTFLRDLLEMVPDQPLPMAEIEPLELLLRRFSTQAMSLGSLSPEAHKTLTLAMNELGGRSNTGEGGEDPDLYLTDGAACKIKQVASGRFGVTAEYLVRANELEIKMAQGSKPGEGGQLPARKVTEYIARIRHATPGTPLISPPPHHDIYSIEDLAQLIHDLHAINPEARIGVKLVSGTGIGVIAAGVAKAGANVITISGHNGGTGSSPLTSIKNTGLPWEIGLRETHETLLRAGLRSRVALRVDGGLRFSRDILIGAILGADEFGFGTAALVAIGCVMARQCHLNTCPVGIATQDEALRMRFNGKPEMVITYFRALGEEIRKGMSELGVRSLTELRGWYDRLDTQSGLDALLVIPASKPRRVVPQQSSILDGGLPEVERQMEQAKFAETKSTELQNFHRSVGTHLSGERMRRQLREKPAAASTHEFHGIAGQSFGAFLAEGLTLKLFGEANDYVGKGLSGGTIIIHSGNSASKRGDVIAGNTVAYGATSGQLFIAGQAGERFAVRNSGATAVVEGLGQHGCEYMTGGIVAVLGPLGLNFGSGMTGGLAYTLRSEIENVLNLEFVQPHELEAAEERHLRHLLELHVAHTGSPKAFRLLLHESPLPFVRIQPVHFQGSLEMLWKKVVPLADPLAPVPAGLLQSGTSAAPHYV